MELFKNSKQKNKRRQRVARGGKRGTTAGRGTKGQKSRSGHRIRPAERDYLIRIPKRRGLRHPSLQEKPTAVNVGDLEKSPKDTFSKADLGNVKILGGGDLTRKITVENLPVSKSARLKIEKAGGRITQSLKPKA